MYGDSIESLGRVPAIDLFITDSDHSANYEWRELEAVKSKLTDNSVVIADNAHSTGVLAEFSRMQKRKFLFFREEPADHWYPGGGIGISFVANRPLRVNQRACATACV